MEAGIYAIIGAFVGALISAISTYLGNRQQLQLRKVELEEQAIQERKRVQELRRKEKLQKYADFLSSYWLEEGYLSDIVDHLSIRQEGWSDRIAEIVEAKEHKDAIARLNEGVAWIGLICDNEHAEEMALTVSHSYDQLMDELIRVKKGAEAGSEVDLHTVSKRLDELREALRTLSKKLREDLQRADIHRQPSSGFG